MAGKRQGVLVGAVLLGRGRAVVGGGLRDHPAADAGAAPEGGRAASDRRPRRPPSPAPRGWCPASGRCSTWTSSRDAAAGRGRHHHRRFQSRPRRAQVDKVSAYLSSVQQLVGNFVQVGPDGRRVKGEFYIQKPGKVRFEYDPPSPIEIVADGQSVVVRDRKLATQDLYPLSQTPLRFLLSDRIDLLRDTNVVGVRADDVYVTVVIEEKQPVIGTSRLMMMFGAKDYQLKQWTVTDPQGYDTTVAVSNLDTSKRPDPGMFKIDYTRYAQ